MTNQHVTSLEWSLKLREAGFDQDTLFSYAPSREDGKTMVLEYNDSCGLCTATNREYEDKKVAAPLATEILALLPEKITLPGHFYIGDAEYNEFWLEIGKSDICYTNGQSSVFMDDGTTPLLPDRIAELYCRLKLHRDRVALENNAV